MTTIAALLSQPLRCARCEQALEASRVDLVTGLAACAHCNRVFTIDHATAILGVRDVIPDTIEPITSSGSFAPGSPSGRATTWAHRPSRVLGIMNLCLGGFTTLLFGACSLGSMTIGQHAVWHLGVGFALIAVPGVVLVFGGIMSLRTRTVISLTANEVTVRSARTPTPTISIPRKDVLGVDASSNHLTGWAVRVIGKDRRATVLLGGLRNEEARYLADEISGALTVQAGVEPPSGSASQLAAEPERRSHAAVHA